MPTKKKQVTVTSKHSIANTLYKSHRGDSESVFGADVEIVCKGGYIPAHSFILGGLSPVLKQHFSQQTRAERERTVIHMSDYAIDDVTPVLHCFYTGRCCFGKNQITSVYEIFEQFGVRSSDLVFRETKPEDMKRKPFIRRYLDMDPDDDDDDDMVEDGEQITIDQIPPEIRARMFAEGGRKSRVENIDGNAGVSTDNKSAKSEQETAPPKRKEPTHKLVKVPPPIRPAQAAKVERDGTTGVKNPDNGNSSSDSDEESASNSNNSENEEGPSPVMPRKRRIIQSDDDSDSVEEVGTKGKQPSNRSNSGKQSFKRSKRAPSPPRSEKRHRPVKTESSSSQHGSESAKESSCDDRRKKKTHSSSSSDCSSSDEDEEYGPSKKTRNGKRRDTRTRGSTSARKLRPRSKGSKSKLVSDDSEEEMRKAKALVHNLRQRKKIKYDENEDEEEELEKHKSSSESECDDSSTYSDSGTTSGSSSSSSSDMVPVTRNNVDDQEVCFLKPCNVPLKKLSQSELDKYNRNPNPEEPVVCNDESSIDQIESPVGSASPIKLRVSKGRVILSSPEMDDPKVAENVPDVRATNLLQSADNVSSLPPKISSKKWIRRPGPKSVRQKEIGPKITCEVTKVIASSSSQNPATIEIENQNTSPQKAVVDLVELPPKELQAELSSSENRNCNGLDDERVNVMTATQAEEALKTCVVAVSPTKTTKEKRTIDVEALKRWWAETRKCQVCNKTYAEHSRATKCLREHKCTRCWICLEVVKLSEKLIDHKHQKHSDPTIRKAHAKCPICQQLVPWRVVQGHITHRHFVGKNVIESQNAREEKDNKAAVSEEKPKSPVNSDSDDDSNRPLVTVKPLALLIESDHDEDEELVSSGPPTLSPNSPHVSPPKLVPAAPAPSRLATSIVESDTRRTLSTSSDFSQSVNRNNIPKGLPWLNSQLRQADSERATNHQSSTARPTSHKSQSRTQTQSSVVLDEDQNIVANHNKDKSSNLLAVGTTRETFKKPLQAVSSAGPSVTKNSSSSARATSLSSTASVREALAEQMRSSLSSGLPPFDQIEVLGTFKDSVQRKNANIEKIVQPSTGSPTNNNKNTPCFLRNSTSQDGSGRNRGSGPSSSNTSNSSRSGVPAPASKTLLPATNALFSNRGAVEGCLSNRTANEEIQTPSACPGNANITVAEQVRNPSTSSSSSMLGLIPPKVTLTPISRNNHPIQSCDVDPLNSDDDGSASISNTFGSGSSMPGTEIIGAHQPSASTSAQGQNNFTETPLSRGTVGDFIADQIKTQLSRRSQNSAPSSTAALCTHTLSSVRPGTPVFTPSNTSQSTQSGMEPGSNQMPLMSNNGVIANNPGKALLVSHHTTAPTSSTTLLSSRNAFQAPRHTASASVSNPESAVAVFRPPNTTTSTSSFKVLRPPTSTQLSSPYLSETGIVHPGTGSVLLNSRDLTASLNMAEPNSQYLGNTTIEGVPFRVYTRPRSSEPHPDSIMSVAQDRVFTDRLTVRSPCDPTRPQQSYPNPQSGMLTPNALSNIHRFQRAMDAAERDEVSNIHREINFASPSSSQQVMQLDTRQPQNIANNANTTDGGSQSSLTGFHCKECNQDFDNQGSLIDHTCFGVD